MTRRVYVCQSNSGQLFLASEELAAVLDQIGPGPQRERVFVGERDGLRWADWQGWRIIAYATGGYSLHREVDGLTGWWLCDDRDFPRHIERMLLCALGLVAVETEGVDAVP